MSKHPDFTHIQHFLNKQKRWQWDSCYPLTSMLSFTNAHLSEWELILQSVSKIMPSLHRVEADIVQY